MRLIYHISLNLYHFAFIGRIFFIHSRENKYFLDYNSINYIKILKMKCWFHRSHWSSILILADNALSMFDIRFPKPNTAMQESVLDNVTLSCYVWFDTKTRENIFKKTRAIFGQFSGYFLFPFYVLAILFETFMNISIEEKWSFLFDIKILFLNLKRFKIVCKTIFEESL